jgi:hypothetical protein
MRPMIDIICACADSERQCGRYNRLSVITRTTYSMYFNTPSMLTEYCTHGSFHLTYSTRKHAPTNSRLPALAPCDGHRYLEHWCAPVSTILALRCVGGTPESAGSSGRQLEGRGYRPKVQSDHREAILTVYRHGVSGTSRGPVGSSPPQQHHLLDTLCAIPF